MAARFCEFASATSVADARLTNCFILCPYQRMYNIASFSKHSILCFEGNILSISSAIVRPSIIKGGQDFG